MLNLTNKEIVTLLIEAITHAICWSLFFYYIRKGWNDGNFGEKRKMILHGHLEGKAAPQGFKKDALYGGIAAFFLVIFRTLSRKLIYKYVDI